MAEGHGGKRANAGRKPSTEAKLRLLLPKEVVDTMNALQYLLGCSRTELITRALAALTREIRQDAVK
jgi:hypothetical protein